MIFLMLGIFAAAVVALAIVVNIFLTVPAFLAHWFWWGSLFLQLVPAYVMQVRAQLTIQSGNLRWSTPELMPAIFGAFLAFVHRHMLSISFGTLLVVLTVFNWKAALLSGLSAFLLALCLRPLALGHARLIIRQVSENAFLRRFLDTGVIE